MRQSFYKKFFHFLLLAAFISICYSNTLDSSWHFDDVPNIVSNQNNHPQSLSWKELEKSFYSPESEKISRPVANLTFAVNYLISGLDTTSYHVLNVLIHIFTAWVAYLIFVYTLQLSSLKKLHNLPAVSWPDIALLGAVLWAIHPIQVQAVTYIVQRMASLAALFYMLAFYSYIRFRLSTGLLRKSVFLLLVLLFFLLGVSTKENAILLPLALAGYEVAFFRSYLVPEKKFVRYLLIFIVLVFVVAFLSFYGEKMMSAMEVYSSRKFTLWERLLTQPLILCRYLFLIFYPRADFLLLETDMVPSKGLLDPPATLLAVVFISTLVLFAVLRLRRYPFVCFAIYFYFLNHLIESTFIPLELYFEHRNYLPSVFIFLAIAYYVFRLLCYYADNKKLFMRNFIILFMTTFLVSEGSAAFLRNDVWRDEISLHTDTIEKAPINPRPYIAIAVQYIDAKQNDKALDYLRQAERMYKKYPDRFQENWVAMIYFNAGLVFRDRQESGKAIKFFLKSIQLDPSEWRSHVNVGILSFGQKDYVHAEDYLYNAVLLHPNCPADLYNLYGRTLYTNKRFEEAVQVFRKGLEIKDRRELHYNLAATYLKTGKVQLAKSEILTMRYGAGQLEGAYLLYRALLFPGEERKKSIRKIALMLIANKIEYCNWISEIKRNDSPRVIFPDISGLEEQLKGAYQAELLKIKDQFGRMIEDTKSCDVPNPSLESDPT